MRVSAPPALGDPFAPSSGFQTAPAHGTSGITPASQALRLAYFRADHSETVGRVLQATTGNGASTPTLIRFGLWLEAANGDLSLVASTPNDTAMLAAAVQEYTKAFSSSYGVVGGSWYAYAPLSVAGTPPSIAGWGPAAAASTGTGGRHRLAGVVTGQSDLPSSISAGSIGASGQVPYAVIIP